MFKRIAITLAGIVGGTMLVAFVLFVAASGEGLGQYVTLLMGCSAAVIVIGGALLSGSSRGTIGEAHGQILRSHPELEELDRQDRARGESIGWVIFFGGFLSGLIGYALHLLM